MNVRDIAEIREELKARLQAAEEAHSNAVIGGQRDAVIQMEGFRLMRCHSEFVLLNRFGVVVDMDLNRSLLTPEQFQENNELRIQEMLASPYYRELKARDPTVAENSEEDESAESALPLAEPCPPTEEDDEPTDEWIFPGRLRYNRLN